MNAYILLDRSGSMAGRWQEALGSLNGYIQELAKDKKVRRSKASVAVFDSVGFDWLRKDVEVGDMKPLTPDEAGPRGGTPLYDAIATLVEAVDADKPKRASIIIITDGEENSSHKHHREAAKAMLDRMRSQGYDVVFLGVDFDAFRQAGALGTMAGQTLNTSAAGLVNTASVLAARSMNYAATGTVASFSDADRQKAS